MDVDHVHIQVAQHAHGPLDGVGNVVELQVQENLVAPGLDLPDDGRTLGVEQLHADLHEGLAALELVQKGQGFVFGGEIQCNDDVLVHRCAPPVKSLNLLTPRLSQSAGRSSMIFLQA